MDEEAVYAAAYTHGYDDARLRRGYSPLGHYIVWKQNRELTEESD